MDLQRWMRYGALVILLAFSAAACDETLAPAGDYDAQRTAQAMEDMVGAVSSDEMANAMGSLSAASGLFSDPPVTAMATEPVNPSVSKLQGLAELSAADFFPAEYLGTTFEWNESEMAYVPSELTGAPEDGIRVLYYAVDPITHQPASPLNQLGYVDLRDLSTLSSDRLGITVVNAAADSLADYYLDVAYALTQSSLTIEVASVGYLSNGEDQLNFDVMQSMSLTDTEIGITQSYSLDLEGTDRALSFTATMTGDPQSQSEEPTSMDAEATITGDGQSVRLVISWADSALDGTLYYNQHPAVLVAGTLDQPTFTDPNGDPLTEEQLNALHTVWEAIGDIFDFVDGLFSVAG